MIIITDGKPNRPNSLTAEADAATSADNARAAGSEIFVVGVGTDAGTTTYLQTEIADDAAHYYSVDNYAGLQAVLAGLDLCE